VEPNLLVKAWFLLASSLQGNKAKQVTAVATALRAAKKYSRLGKLFAPRDTHVNKGAFRSCGECNMRLLSPSLFFSAALVVSRFLKSANKTGSGWAYPICFLRET
jgi:hypothetical protein